MNTTDSCHLLFGPYRTPIFRYGDVVICERVGQVEIIGMTSAPIPWPIGKRGRSRAIILCGDLVTAVRQEAAIAVSHWWGVGVDTVWRWRKALCVGPTTTGTTVLRGEILLGEQGERMRQLARARDHDIKRRAKIAAARRGKPRPAHVVEAVRQAHLGTTMSAETRRKRSEAHRRRRTRPPKAGRTPPASDTNVKPDSGISQCVFTAGTTRNVYFDAEVQYVLDVGEMIRGVWLLDAEADTPFVVTEERQA